MKQNVRQGLGDLPEPVASRMDEPDRNMRAARLIQIIESLPDELKDPFLLHYQGYKYEEIRFILMKKYKLKETLPLGTVKSRISLCRTRLKEILSHEGTKSSFD